MGKTDEGVLRRSCWGKKKRPAIVPEEDQGKAKVRRRMRGKQKPEVEGAPLVKEEDLSAAVHQHQDKEKRSDDDEEEDDQSRKVDRKRRTATSTREAEKGKHAFDGQPLKRRRLRGKQAAELSDAQCGGHKRKRRRTEELQSVSGLP